MDNSGHSVTPIVLMLPLGKGECKGVELDADVSLNASFGWLYVQFNLPVASLWEPVAKHPCCSSALNVLLVNAAGHELPGK